MNTRSGNKKKNQQRTNEGAGIGICFASMVSVCRNRPAPSLEGGEAYCATGTVAGVPNIS